MKLRDDAENTVVYYLSYRYKPYGIYDVWLLTNFVAQVSQRYTPRLPSWLVPRRKGTLITKS